MRSFAYERVTTVADAVKASSEGAMLIAGGTELVNWMKEAIVSPTRLVDINGITGLDRIHFDGDKLRIGALVRMSTLAESPDVLREFPALAQALDKSASQQIRNMASMGGNLLQRTRCPYFRADVPLPCNKRRPGSGCSAIGGEDRASAIFGGSEVCIATHPSDAAVALTAFGATIRVAGPNGTRTIPLADLYRLPGNSADSETVLGPGDVVVELMVPRVTYARHSHYLKVRERASYEFALVSAAAAVDLAEGTIRAARIALGGVAPKPWRLQRAETALIGLGITDVSALHQALAEDFSEARPGKHNGFKIALAQRTALRALQVAGGAA